MAKKEIKEQNKDLEINVVDLISKFDPSETNKYTKFLTKILKNHIKQRESDYNRKELTRSRLNNRRVNLRRYERPRSKNVLEMILINYLQDVFGNENMDTLLSFHEHAQKNRIIGKDINTYNSWEDIQKDVAIADLKQNEKLLKKEIKIIFENEEWLFLLPLTIEASLSYGSGTKWCTASKSNKEYFYRYSNNGVLCYAISKIAGDKYGLYYDFHSLEFSLWDVIDKRIDSLQSTIPLDLLGNIFKLIKFSQNNYSYFSEQEKKRSNTYWNQEKYESPIAEVEAGNEIGDVEPVEILEPYTQEIDGGEITYDGGEITYNTYNTNDEVWEDYCEPTNDIVVLDRDPWGENPQQENELPV